MRLARSATDYTQRTGINGFDLSPYQLAFAQRVLDERDRLEWKDTARSVEIGSAAAHGAKVEWEKI